MSTVDGESGEVRPRWLLVVLVSVQFACRSPGPGPPSVVSTSGSARRWEGVSVPPPGGTSPPSSGLCGCWGKYLDRVQTEHPEWTHAKTPSRYNRMSQPSPLQGTQINPGFATGGKMRMELYINRATWTPTPSCAVWVRRSRRRIPNQEGRSLPTGRWACARSWSCQST